MWKRKPKTEKAMQIESLFFKRLKEHLEYNLWPGEYTKRDILSLIDDIYRLI